MRTWSRVGGKHPEDRISVVDPTMLHLWSFDEVLSSSPARDSKGSSGDLTILGGSPAASIGPVNFRSRTFNLALGNFFRTNTTFASEVTQLTNCTVAGYIKLSSLFAADGYICLLGDTGQRFIVAVVVAWDGVASEAFFRFVYHDTGGTFRTINFRNVVLSRQKWYPFVITRSESGGTATYKLYLEGGLAETVTTTNLVSTTSTPKWHVGCDVGPGFGTRFNGDMSTLAIYGGAMSDAKAEDTLSTMRGISYDTTVYCTVEVQDGNGTYRELTSLRRIDFLKRVRISESIDNKLKTATITCMRDKHDMHLGRFNDNVLNRRPFAGSPASTT
jgi:hypothetical protein